LKTWKHAPFFGLQHALMHGLGLQVMLPIHVPVQSDWNVVMQVKPFTQHEPSGGHGLGVHDEPAKGDEFVGQRSPNPTVEHAPVKLLQHTRTHGLGLHVVLAIHWPLHAAWTVCVHVVAPCWQHAPNGGQGLGLHDVAPVGWNHPGTGQTEPPKTWQTLVDVLQQTTVGGTQLFTEAQVLPTPCHWPEHAACDCTIVHTGWPAAFTVQHAPHVGTQITGGRHVPPAVYTSSGPTHWLGLVTVHVPAHVSQHAPLGRHGLGVHDWPLK
jgi:hypothetical protein